MSHILYQKSDTSIPHLSVCHKNSDISDLYASCRYDVVASADPKLAVGYIYQQHSNKLLRIKTQQLTNMTFGRTLILKNTPALCPQFPQVSKHTWRAAPSSGFQLKTQLLGGLCRNVCWCCCCRGVN